MHIIYEEYDVNLCSVIIRCMIESSTSLSKIILPMLLGLVTFFYSLQKRRVYATPWLDHDVFRVAWSLTIKILHLQFTPFKMLGSIKSIV